MDVLPSQFTIALPDDGLPAGDAGPALIGPDGTRTNVSQATYDAMEFVAAAMAKDFAVKVTALRLELPIDEAAHAIGMSGPDLRAYAAEGEFPFRSSKYVDWVNLEDVLAFNRRLKTQRREALDAMLSESVYDDGDTPADDGPTA